MTSSHSNIASSDGIEVRLIVGMSRAGTTSMVSLLNSRGDCAAFGETGFGGRQRLKRMARCRVKTKPPSLSVMGGFI